MCRSSVNRPIRYASAKKVNKNATSTLQVETCLSASSITFSFLSELLPTYNIFAEFIPSTPFIYSCSWVDSSHLQQKSASRVRDESSGAVDSSWVIFRIRLESQKIATWVRVNDSTRYNTGWVYRLAEANL